MMERTEGRGRTEGGSGGGPGGLGGCCAALTPTLPQLRPLGFGRAETLRLIQVKRTRRGGYCENFKNFLKYKKQSQQPDSLISWNGVWEKGASP